MNGHAISYDSVSLPLFDPLAPVPAPVGNFDVRGRAGFRHTDLITLLTRALAARYPVVRRLIGDDSFLDAARRFVAMQPPRLPIAQRFGETFPHYLRSLGDTASFEYVAGVAELEAARARAYHSADAAPLGAQALSFLSTAHFDEFGVVLHPSVELVASRFPIVTIWKANQTDNAGFVDCWCAEAALVTRPFLEVDVLLLPPGGHVFMTALFHGSTIAGAIATAMARDPAFDPTSNLTLLAEADMVVGFRRYMAEIGIGRVRTAALAPQLPTR